MNGEIVLKQVVENDIPIEGQFSKWPLSPPITTSFHHIFTQYTKLDSSAAPVVFER